MTCKLYIYIILLLQYILVLSYIVFVILDYCLYPGSNDLVMDLWHVNKWNGMDTKLHISDFFK
jgi:hypothetical protein